MAKKNKTLNYDELKKWLVKLDLHQIERRIKYEDDSQDFALRQGYTMTSVEKMSETRRAKITIGQVVPYGTPCLCDAIGGDMSIIVPSKNTHRLPDGRVINAEFDRTLIKDTQKKWGVPPNGVWIIPQRFFE